MKKIVALLLCYFIGINSFCQTATPASTLIAEAKIKAKKEHKKIFVKFTASWCGWCKKMDAAMQDSTCNKFFDDNFIVVELDADERADKKQLENPGAANYRIKYNGDENQGIPFWFILDADEKLLADCYIRPAGTPLTEKGENMACPATESEVTAFIAVLKKVTPLKENELKIIYDRFRKNENVKTK